MKMSKTAAIKIARDAVSQPIGNRTSWMLIGPYRANDIEGPTTEINADSYWSALAKRTKWVAFIALVLMGYDAADVDYWTHELCGRETTINGLIDACIAKMA